MWTLRLLDFMNDRGRSPEEFIRATVAICSKAVEWNCYQRYLSQKMLLVSYVLHQQINHQHLLVPFTSRYILI
jgi:hypothetical protein